MKLRKVDLINSILDYKPKISVGALWKRSLSALNKLLKDLKKQFQKS